MSDAPQNESGEPKGSDGANRSLDVDDAVDSNAVTATDVEPNPPDRTGDRLRRFVLVVFVAMFMTWPAVHRYLNVRHHFNPWKMGGWAMYTTAVPQMTADATDLDGRRLPYRDPDEYNQLMYDYMLQLKDGGALLNPLPILELFAQQYAGQVNGVRLTLERVWLNGRTGYFEERPMAVYEVHLDRDGTVVWSGRTE